MLRISDLETKEVIFYDEEFKDKCFKFCQQRDIEFLPALDEPTKIYVRDDSAGEFRVEFISPERIIEGSQTAFHPKVLEAFRQNHLLFVYSNDEFSGVVHFSDFNKSAVSTYLFQVLFQYERTLRIFLQECGFGNLDIVKYFEDKVANAKKESSKDYHQRKIDGYFKHKDKAEKLPPFQSFYLDDLISFANSRGNNLKVDVIELRNMVMHAHEIVNGQDRSLDNYIFDYASFEKFYRQALALHDDIKKVKNKVAFLQGLDETVRFQ